MKILFLCFLFYFTFSGITQQTFPASTFKQQKHWLFLGKMVLSPGTITIEFQTIFGSDLKEPVQIEFGMISDQFFETQNKYRCENAQNKMTTYLHTLYPNKKPSFTRVSMDNHEEHMYYFVMKDCKKELASNKTIGIYTVTTKLTIMNADSHLGSEEDMWYIYPLIIIVSIWLISDHQGKTDGWTKELCANHFVHGHIGKNFRIVLERGGLFLLLAQRKELYRL